MHSKAFLAVLLSTALSGSLWAADQAFLGVTLTEGEDDTPDLQVETVLPETAAARVGLQPGDVLLRFGDHPLASVDDLVAALGHHEAGQVVRIVFQRGEQRQRREVRLGSVPVEDAGVESEEVEEGGELAEAAEPGDTEVPARGYLGISVDDGEQAAVVLEILEGTAAATAGLRRGDQITHAHGQRVHDADELIEALGSAHAGDHVEIAWRRPDRERPRSAWVQLGRRPVQSVQDHEHGEEHELDEDRQQEHGEEHEHDGDHQHEHGEEHEHDEDRQHEHGGELGALQPGVLGVQLGDGEGGAWVLDVFDSSAAAGTELRPGDRIVLVDEHGIGDADDLIEVLGSRHAGDRVVVGWRREGSDDLHRARVQLGHRPRGEDTELGEDPARESQPESPATEPQRDLELSRGVIEALMAQRQRADAVRAAAEAQRSLVERLREQASSPSKGREAPQEDEARPGSDRERELRDALEEMARRLEELRQRVKGQGRALAELQRALQEKHGEARDDDREGKRPRTRRRRGDGGE